MLDINALLQSHPEIAKYLCILLVISEGMAMLPETIIRANSVLELIIMIIHREPLRIPSPPETDKNQK